MTSEWARFSMTLPSTSHLQYDLLPFAHKPHSHKPGHRFVFFEVMFRPQVPCLQRATSLDYRDDGDEEGALQSGTTASVDWHH